MIAYAHGAVTELIDDGVTGHLIPPRDIDAAVVRVAELSEDPKRAGEMGNAGRATITRQYTPENLRDNLWSAFETMLSRPIRGPSPVDKPVSIIVPVFNAHDEVSNCLRSLKRTVLLKHARVIIIDDGSTDPRIADLLSRYANNERFVVAHNSSNIGYTRTINRGIDMAGRDDVVLLNSDTETTAGWLEGLQDTAYHRAKVATVTAMGDNAGAFSFPRFDEPNPVPAGVSREEFAAAIVASTEECVPVEVPTGSGFCLYIRRSLIDEIGKFDHDAFPRGYGEENDFCMRALKSGWRNFISPSAYVFHVRNASFGEEKATLIKAGVDTVTRRYPDYAPLVKEAFDGGDMAALRKATSIGVAKVTEAVQSHDAAPLASARVFASQS